MIIFVISFYSCNSPEKWDDVTVYDLVLTDLELEVESMFKSYRVKIAYVDKLSEMDRASRLVELSKTKAIHEKFYQKLVKGNIKDH